MLSLREGQPSQVCHEAKRPLAVSVRRAGFSMAGCEACWGCVALDVSLPLNFHFLTCKRGKWLLAVSLTGSWDSNE